MICRFDRLLVTVQAVSFMIKMAYQKKDIFIKENFVFMQIGGDIIIDKVLIVIQLISFALVTLNHS